MVKCKIDWYATKSDTVNWYEKVAFWQLLKTKLATEDTGKSFTVTIKIYFRV